MQRDQHTTLGRTIDPRLKDIDGRNFYLGPLNPFQTFNQTEINLSHIFRNKTPVLGDRTYSDYLFDYMNQQGYLRAEVIEIGCGLGDLALNYLNALDRYSGPIIHYRMYDISPSLIEIDRNRLGDRVQDYILADCLDLTQHIPSFGGTIVSNGLMADLRSVYISHNDQLPTYNVTDEDLADFVSDHQASEKRIGWYLHVGSLQFLREIAACLDSGGVALLAEYSATDRNQPARFDGHFECGIDFNQLLSYADRLNLEPSWSTSRTFSGSHPISLFFRSMYSPCKTDSHTRCLPPSSSGLYWGIYLTQVTPTSCGRQKQHFQCRR